MSREQQHQLPRDRQVHHSVNSDTPPPLNVNKVSSSTDHHAPTLPLGGPSSHFFSGACQNIWSPTTTLHGSHPSSATSLASNIGAIQHPTLHPQHLPQPPILSQEQQQQYFPSMQDDINSFENSQQTLADSLQSLTPEQEQHLLNLLQAQWLQQQEPQSLDPSYNLRVDQQMMASVNTHLNTNSASNFMGMNTASPLMPLTSQNAGPNQRSYSVSQDYFGDLNATAGSASTGSSGSLHRSSSDLGTRINSHHMDLGDFSDTDHSIASDTISQALSHLYSNQRQLGQFTVNNPVSTLSNGSDNSFSEYLLENTTKSCLPSVGSGLPGARPIDQSDLLLSSQEVSGFGSEKLHRAPGTPLSPTPPPKFSTISTADCSSTSSLHNGSLKSPTSNASNSADFLGAGTNNGVKGRRNKKGKAGSDFNTTVKQQQPPTLSKLKPTPDVASSQKRSQEPPTPSAPSQGSSLFYSSDQNALLGKMGNLSSSFVNWISSDKSRSTKPAESVQSRYCGTSFEAPSSSVTGVRGLPNKTKTEALSQKGLSGSGDKLSYSDVLSNSKTASDKSTNSEQSSHQSGAQSTENNSVGSRRMKCSDNQGSSAYVQSQSQNAYKKCQGGNVLPLPSSPYLNKKSSKPTLTFGTRVGLDEFTIPTLEEELALSSSRRNSILFPYDITIASGKSNNSSLGPEASLPPTPNCGSKKSKVSASAGPRENSTLLNNNNKVQSLKQSLKKSSFINNLSENSTCSSGGESSSGGAGQAFDPDQRQQPSTAVGRGSQSDTSNQSTDAEDTGSSDKDSSSRTPSTQQSSPQHSRTSGGRGSGGYGPGGGGGSSGVGTTRFRSSNSSGKGKAGKNTSNNNTSNNNRKRKETDNSTSEWQAQLAVSVAACLVYAASAARWLYHLVLEVFEMSAALVWTAWVWGRASFELHGRWFWALVRRYWATLLDKTHFWRHKGSKKRLSRGEAHYLEQHIPLPATGEEAMKRLLACRGLDNYSVLGVTPDATQEDIRRYYRRQAFLVHPDKNKTPGAEEAFKVLGHAFEEIGEPAKREEYDKRVLGESQLGEAWDKLADLLKDLERKLEEAANMIRCTSCPNKHLRVKVPDRPVYAARYCDQCNIRHPAKEGDIWAESWYWGLRWQYFACMDGGVYNISEWAACQAGNLKQLKANTHAVQYRIVAGKKKTGRDQHRPPHDMPSEPEIEEFFNQLYRDKFSSSFPPPSSPQSSSQAGDGVNSPPPTGGGKRRDARGTRRNRR